MNATASDFTRWEQIALKYTESELFFAIDDCEKAADAMATHPQPNKEGYYRDQANTFRKELTRRQKRKENKTSFVYLAMVPHVDDNIEHLPAVASRYYDKIQKYIGELPKETKEECHVMRIELI